MGKNEALFSAFVASMPPAYRSAFDSEAIYAHEAIVRRRQDRRAHIEIWREFSERVVAICVVADDKPGLLSCISAALVATQIDVVSAHAYCRTRADRVREAVDFLWIRRLPGADGRVPPIRARDIVAVADAIDRAIGNIPKETPSTQELAEAPISERVANAQTPEGEVVRDKPPFASARIRFETDPKDGSTILTVEAVDRPGLLLAVTQALFHAGLQIVGLRATTERGCAVDRFHLAEVDGSALRQDRLLTLQTAILGALDEGTLAPLRRSAS